MRKIILAVVCATLAWGVDVNQKLFALYQQGEYAQACQYGHTYFAKGQHAEPFVAMLGFACLKADEIDRLTPLIPFLSQNTQSRSNSSYFALLVMQKRLLLQALYDQKSLKGLAFPRSSHLLSRIFERYLRDPQAGAMVKSYADTTNPRQSYQLYIMRMNNQPVLVIDEFYDKILTVHHVYQ